ncbi:MAG: UvrD-helicase domain-containing protein [Victivallaceae bacterium]|nr:UvrD-helicase domain-containing protein [Victivallaceae bacterium]
MINSYNLKGLNLIEASAGTGKTFTVSHLYLRLLLEKRLAVKQILVVTFTVAATVELRDRIRTLIAEKLGGANAEDTIILKKALLEFDEAAIYTIHSFCERILNENSFESRMLFNTELQKDCSHIRQLVVDDYVRKQLEETDNIPSRPEFDELVKLYHRAPLAQFDRHLIEDAEKYDEHGNEVTKFVNNTLYHNQRIKIDHIKERYPELRWPEHAAVLDEIDNATSQKDFKKAYDRLKNLKTALTAIHFLNFYRERLKLMRQHLNFRSFDDILSDLYQSLQGDSGKILIEAVRDRYSAVMIDECQDTDKVQFEIFRRFFFEDSTLPCFLIGDPKQSIYGFRSADIFSYLEISRNVESRYTLDTNYRSATCCVTAQNSIFQHMTNPFLLDNLNYHPVKASPQSKGNLTRLLFAGSFADEAASGIDFYNLDLPDFKNRSGIRPAEDNDIEKKATEAAAAHIAHLLNANTDQVWFESENDRRALKPSDIAILVMTHTQGRKILDRLRRFNIPAVIQNSGDVFKGQESDDLMLVLKAVLSPDRRRIFNGALLSSICGVTPSELDRMLNDDNSDNDYEKHMERFRKYHKTWQERGFLPMFNGLLKDYQTEIKLLGNGQYGERQLTNILQLAEILNETESQIRGMDSLLEWFSEQRNSEPNQEYEMRLEKDDEAVKIMTVFASKGLEFPLVFCPFLWSKGISSMNRKKLGLYHDPQTHAAMIGLTSYQENIDAINFEEKAEIMRLFYVALSRARNKCWIYWNRTNKVNAISYLLEPDSTMPDSDDTKNEVIPELPGVRFLKYQKLSETTLYRQPVRKELFPPPEPPAPNLLRSGWGITSFSSLTSSHYNINRNVFLSHDGELKEDDDSATVQEESAESNDFIGFPRGIVPGNFLHRIFENLDFTLVNQDYNNAMIRRSLREFGITASHKSEDDLINAVNSMLDKVMNTPLPPDNTIRLSAIPENKRLTEMEFHFAIKHSSASAPLDFPDMPVLEKHWRENSIPTGFMNGKIDLIFEHANRFYILDWKSNYLGHSPEHYTPEQLKSAMDEKLYNFQYLIYSVALDLWLNRKCSDYSYEKHFGGVFYIFLRGVGQGSNGIFFDRPDKTFFNNFKQHFNNFNP